MNPRLHHVGAARPELHVLVQSVPAHPALPRPEDNMPAFRTEFADTTGCAKDVGAKPALSRTEPVMVRAVAPAGG